MDPNPRSYILSDDVSREIFDYIVLNELHDLIGHHHQDDGKQPLAVLLLGQTGAGKTRLAPELKAGMLGVRRTPAHFIADTYKTYHPQYAQLLDQQPGIASAATGPDARKWLAMACQYAVNHRMDVLVESACRHVEDFIDLAGIFHDADYRVQVVLLAVPEALSRLGIMVRFYSRLPEGQSRNLPLRLTPKKIHDETVKGLLAAAVDIDNSATVDHVVVVRRGNKVAYSNERLPNGRWAEPATVAETLLAERKRPLSSAELNVAMADIKMLKEQTTPEIVAQIVDVERLITPLQLLGDHRGPFPDLRPFDPTEFVASGLGRDAETKKGKPATDSTSTSGKELDRQ